MSNRFVEMVDAAAVEVAGGHIAALRLLRGSPALLDPPANILNPPLFLTAVVVGALGNCCVLSVGRTPSSSFAFAFFARFESNIILHLSWRMLSPIRRTGNLVFPMRRCTGNLLLPVRRCTGNSS
jgi:hypothetical protein